MAFPDPSSQQYYPSPTGPTFGSGGTDRAQMEQLPSVRSDTLPRVSLQGVDQVRYPENNATGKGVAAIGDLVSSVVKATDTVIKDNITKQLYDGADKVRADFGVEEATKVAQSGQVLPSGKAADMADPPLAVKKLGNQVQGLQDKFEAGGLSPSYFSAKLEAMVRSVREQHPGYRKEIDEETQRITGQTPANALVTGLRKDVEELNKKLQAKVTEYQKFLVTNAGYLPSNWQQMEQADVHKKVIDNKGYEHRMDEARKPLLSTEDATGMPMTPDQRQKFGVQGFGIVADQVVQKFFNDGIEGIKLTPQNIQSMILEAKKPGAKPWTPQQLGEISGQLDLYERTITNAVRQEGLRRLQPDKPWNFRSHIADEGKFNEVIQGALKPIAEMKQSIKDGDFGILGVQTATLTAKVNQRHAELLEHPEMVSLEAGRKVLGNEGLNLWLTLSDQSGKSPISAVTRALNGTRVVTSALTPDGKAPLVNEIERRMGDGKKKGPIAVEPRELNSLLNDHLAAANNPLVISKISPEHRANTLLNTFQNLDTMIEKGMIKTDSYEPFLKKVLAPSVTKGITDLKDTNPVLFETYKDQAFRMFKAVYIGQVGEVNDIVKNKSYSVEFNEAGGLVVKFDKERFPDAAEPLEAGRRIKKLNEGLTLLGPIMKAAGISPEDGMKAIGIELKRPLEEATPGGAAPDANPLGGDAERRAKSKRNIEKQQELKGKKTSQLDFTEPPTPRGNLTDEASLGIKIDDIPENMSAREFFRYAQSRP